MSHDDQCDKWAVASITSGRTWAGETVVTPEWIAAMPFLFLMLILAIASRIGHGSWLAPGPFFAGIWLFYLLLPMIVAGEFYVWWGAVLAIVSAALAVNTGSLLGLYLGRGTRINQRVSPKNRHRLAPPLVVLVLLGTICGMASIVVILSDLGQGIRTLFSLQDLVEAAAQNSIIRYQEGYVPPLVARVLTTGVYFAPLAGGMLFEIEDRYSRRMVAFLPFLPAILWSIVMTTKASVLFCVILWMSSYFAAYLWASDDTRQWAWRGIFWKNGVAIGLVGTFMVVVQMARYGDIDTDGAWYVMIVLKTAFLGYLAGFSTWFDVYLVKMGSPNWGAYTFAGVYELLGIATRDLGIYGDQTVDVGDSRTNIYTIFRSLIQDFTLVGALVLLTLAGIGAGYAFARIRMGNILPMSGVSLFFAATLLSHVTSLFAYNTLILAFALWWGALLLLRRYYLSSTPRVHKYDF